jgi:hypothetical protein
MQQSQPTRRITSTLLFSLLVLSACSVSTQSPNQSVTTSTIDPFISITEEVAQFVRSYVDQAVIARPELVSKVSQSDLSSCVTSAVQQIARGTAMGIKQTSAEETSSWYARSRSAALQSAQSSIEGVVASCTR